jgi:hypothetical protein
VLWWIAVALAEKHRTAIYAGLSPVVGEEAIEALLSQFPARDVDEPVTKDFVARQLAEQDARLKEYIHNTVNAAVGSAVGSHREETRHQFYWLLGIQFGMLATLAIGALSALIAAGR